jgi:hypothetical protein
VGADEAAMLALHHRLETTTAALQSTQRELRTVQMVKVGRPSKCAALSLSLSVHLSLSTV